MRQRRFLAPWHRKDLMESALDGLAEKQRKVREAELRALQGRSVSV